jgi:hypothetical protein
MERLTIADCGSDRSFARSRLTTPRGGEAVKLLSESLEDLAARVKALEDTAATELEANRAVLEERRREVEAAFESAINELQAAVRDAGATALERWNDTTSSIARQIEAMQSAQVGRQAEREAERADGAADLAAQDAAAATALAAYCLNVAEYAVVDAALARAEADELAGRTQS